MMENANIIDSISDSDPDPVPKQGGKPEDTSASELDLLLSGPTMEDADADSDGSAELEIPGMDD